MGVRFVRTKDYNVKVITKEGEAQLIGEHLINNELTLDYFIEKGEFKLKFFNYTGDKKLFKLINGANEVVIPVQKENHTLTFEWRELNGVYFNGNKIDSKFIVKLPNYKISININGI